jgi:hypothetical protein
MIRLREPYKEEIPEYEYSFDYLSLPRRHGTIKTRETDTKKIHDIVLKKFNAEVCSTYKILSGFIVKRLN